MLTLTEKEAFEAVLLKRTMQVIEAEQMKETRDTEVQRARAAEGLGPPKVKVITGAVAEEVADKPLLTGDDEWDAVEREETDPMREPFNMEQFI